MTVHKVAEAFPLSGSTNVTTIQQKLAAGFPLVIETGDDAEDLNFDAAGGAAAVVPEVIIVRDTKTVFGREEGNNDAHNGTTVLVTACGKHYTTGLSAQNFTNALTRTNTPPDTPAAGDRVIVGDAPTGDFAGQAKKLTYYNGGQWVFVSPVIGQRVYVRDEEVDYQYTESGTWEQAGEVAADSVGASELAFPWGMVVEEETATPPGTRVTGATPTMPLGGTAANINDDDTNTTATTDALGDLSSADLSGRIVAQLDLGEVLSLAAIEVKEVKRSSSNNSGWAFYYSEDGSNFTQLGSTFSVTDTEADIARSSTFDARYVALVAPQANYSTVTLTLSDLNAYKQATSLADGTKVIVAASGIGAFSGHDTEVAEAWNGAFRFYTPYEGASVHDLDLRIKRVFLDGVWESEKSGYAEVLDNFVAAAATISQVGTSGESLYGFSDTVGPTTSAHGKFEETLTLSVRADYPGQVFDIIYDASMPPFTFAKNSGANFDRFDLTAAIFIDSVSDSKDHRLVYRNFDVGNATLTVGYFSSVYLPFKLTLEDTDPHTVKIMLFGCAYTSAGGKMNTATNSIAFARRRLKALRRS